MKRIKSFIQITEDTMKKLLGIDVGTTGTKTLLVTEDGEVIGSSYCGYETKK